METRIKGVLSPKASGSITITENGNYDVVDVANAVVEVPIPEGYIKPEGTLEVTKNGIYDVTEKESVNVATSGYPLKEAVRKLVISKGYKNQPNASYLFAGFKNGDVNEYFDNETYN